VRSRVFYVVSQFNILYYLYILNSFHEEMLYYFCHLLFCNNYKSLFRKFFLQALSVAGSLIILADLLHATLGNDLVLTGTHTAVSGLWRDTAIAIGVGSYYTVHMESLPMAVARWLTNTPLCMILWSLHLLYGIVSNQTNITNSNDGEVFISPSGTIWCWCNRLWLCYHSTKHMAQTAGERWSGQQF